MENKKWFIPGSVPSSKNGRRWTGKYFIASKTVVNYRKLAKDYYIKFANDFKSELSKYKTILLVSHRKSVLSECNKIFEIKEKKIKLL